MGGIKKTLQYEYEAKYKKSYNGIKLNRVYTEISAYDKDCGSASQLEIRIEENWQTQKNRYMERVIITSLPKEKAIELRDILNSIEF